MYLFHNTYLIGWFCEIHINCCFWAAIYDAQRIPANIAPICLLLFRESINNCGQPMNEAKEMEGNCEGEKPHTRELWR